MDLSRRGREGRTTQYLVELSVLARFSGQRPQVLGKSIRLSGNTYTVIGVMPSSFALPRELADIFVSPWVAYPEAAPDRDVHFMHSYWRLKPGVTLSQAQSEIAEVDRRLAEQFPVGEKGRRQTTD